MLEQVGNRRDILADLNVLVIRKDKRPLVECGESQSRPKRQVTCLGVSVQFAESFRAAEIGCRVNQLSTGTAPAKVGEHRDPFEFRERPEITNAQTSNRAASAVGNEVRTREVVAVKLFVVWAILLAEIHRRSDRCGLHDVVKGVGDGNAYAIGPGSALWIVAVVGRPQIEKRRRIGAPGALVSVAAIAMDFGVISAIPPEPEIEAERVIESTALLGHRSCDKVGVAIERCLKLLHDEPEGGSYRALGVD